jgi:phosphohistidine phosphatase
MKTLYLVRHAKSSWKNLNLTDKERPLNKRGKRDAPFMGIKLKEMKLLPELMISSNAVRAKKTAYAIAKEIDYDKDNIVLTDEVYEASTIELLNIIKQLNQEFKSIMMFGHNPALTGFHNYLTDQYIDNIPTCGITGIRFENQWADINERSGKFLFFIYPKMYKK